ncbi:MAG: nitroreductase family protein [Candidatus Cloacimonetes bacterium]|nr:nitroreductase family protein [Candidatus Cloacimonadota bacterium]
MLLDIIKSRFSVRKFRDDPVRESDLHLILEAARLAPSARNLQEWHFVVIRDKGKRRQLTDICRGQSFVAEAPVTIAVCAGNTDYIMACGEKAYTVDAAIAAEHIVLQAAELGLGTCWIGAFYQDGIARLINLPENMRVVALIPLGYPGVTRKERLVKEFTDIVSFDSF